MILLIFLSTVITASLSQPTVTTWTLNGLSTAIEKNTNEDMYPFFVDALNQMMYAIFTGKEKDVLALILSPTGNKTWTRDQLKNTLESQNIDSDYMPFIRRAYHQLAYNVHPMHTEGNQLSTEMALSQNSVEVVLAALDISVWTVSDVKEAIGDPSTKLGLLPHLKKAEDIIQKALKAGEKEENIKVTLVTPVGLVPKEGGTFPDIVPRIAL